MISPALTALLLAFVYSTIGITLERTADFDNAQASLQNVTSDKMTVTKSIARTPWTNVNNSVSSIKEDVYTKYDDIYSGNDDILIKNLEGHKMNLKKFKEKESGMRNFVENKYVPWKNRSDNKYVENKYVSTKNRSDNKYVANNETDSKSVAKKHNIDNEYIAKKDINDGRKKSKGKRRVKRSDETCEPFEFKERGQMQISHPSYKNNTNTYARNVKCVTTINASHDSVIQLTFVDMFHIEDHPECAYDFLQIRDGMRGYSKEIATLCGHQFPRQIVTTGPYAWLKFVSDDTIEYEGFRINIGFLTDAKSYKVPEECTYEIEGDTHGVIGTAKIKSACLEQSKDLPLDVLWAIRTPENTKIYLNFTSYTLDKPNECEENVLQVFGSELEYSSRLAHYCGSVANSVTSESNEMYVRFFSRKLGKANFDATYTAFRTLDSSKDEKCDETEFDCEDNTCIDAILMCDSYAHCRLKADEDPDACKRETTSMISQPHILVILVIFSLLLSGMSFIFLFKCIRKLYQDHKIIKEHIRQSCEDRLDSLVGSRLTLDAKRLERDSEPRVSLERENHTNEMFKRQRSYSKHKPSSIDSDFPEVPLDPEEEPWRRPSETIPVVTENVRIEHNGRPRRSDTSKKEESVRSKSVKESDEAREKKEIRDVSVGAPDTKESGCQTRESLFQTETAPSSDGSGSNGPAFSTFGYSGATIARPSPPPQTNTSEITIELLSQVPQHQPKSYKKLSDRRPMSAETTRSAPDVIIVSKPIR